jgi:hypothetical protein
MHNLRKKSSKLESEIFCLMNFCLEYDEHVESDEDNNCIHCPVTFIDGRDIVADGDWEACIYIGFHSHKQPAARVNA